MIYRYLRFSTSRQDEAQQVFAIDHYLENKGLTADKTYADRGISGSKSYKERQLLDLCKELNEGDTVIVSEVSRITRSGIGELFEVIEKYFKPNKIKLVVCDISLEIDCADVSPVAEMMLSTMAMCAKIEKKCLVGRVRNKLGSIKEELAATGVHTTQKGKNKGRTVTKLGSDTWTVEQMQKAGKASGERKTDAARQNPHNVFFFKFITNYEQNHGKIYGRQQVEKVVKELNFLDAKTSTGMEFTVPRYYAMVKKCNAIYIVSE